MRIIAGKYKNKKIELSKEANFRPTTGKTKEAVFSILSSGDFLVEGKPIFADSTIIELFAGSGAYSFEALSRGAQKAIIIDIEQDNINLINHNAKKIGITEEVITIRADATCLPKARVKCDVAFIDPPYRKNLLVKSLNSLLEGGWLNNNAIIIAEEAHNNNDKFSSNFEVVEERIYGKSKLKIIKYNE